MMSLNCSLLIFPPKFNSHSAGLFLFSPASSRASEEDLLERCYGRGQEEGGDVR